MTDLAQIAARLTEAQRRAFETLPLPYDGVPHLGISPRPYSSTWRKSSKHRDTMHGLEDLGIAQRTVSRGETLWRLTKPLGLSLAQYLRSQANG